ncbi:hypothetical protein [Pontibacter sp. G13]|uniref:hypothetical protein n=1 Tax=Pontibacter sp. G13 TaxID=3074898 RepID=UPI00288B4B55|nr:hypothetical protein [Pontibacter sp. G13]WNJ16167.1 hypothetical protein RJD25_14990 [Pontibacter sp. G13]
MLEFDGNSWELHRMAPNSGIKSLAADESGKIYVGGQGILGYFEPNALGELVFFDLSPLIPETFHYDEIWDTYITPAGIYFCTHKYIFFYHDDLIEVITPPGGIRFSHWTDHQLFVSGWDSGLLKLEDDQLVPIPGGEIFQQKSIRAILPIDHSQLLIATFDGLFYTYDGNEFALWDFPMASVFRSALVLRIVRLRDGRLAIGTQNQGLYVLSERGDFEYHLDRGTGLLGHSVTDIHEDELGHIWVTQNPGITHVFLGAPFIALNEQTGIRGAGYASIGWRGNLIAGTSGGAYELKDDRFQEIPGSAGQVYAFAEVRGKLLMGHHNSSFRLNESNEFVPLHGQMGSWDFQIDPERPSEMVQGNQQGIWRYTWKDGGWKYKGSIKGFSESSRLFHFDEAGDIWVSHGFKGVFHVKLNETRDSAVSVKFYGEANGFPSDALINVFKVQNRLVFGTIDGAYRYDAPTDTFLPDEELSELLGNGRRLIELEEDAAGNLYYIMDNDMGLLRKKNSGRYEHERTPFELISPLLSDDLENITSIDYSRIMIGAKEGFLLFNPNQPIRKRDSISLYLREIRGFRMDSLLFGGHLPSLKPGFLPQFELPFDQRAFVIRVASPVLELTDRVEYRFMVEGLDPDWTPWSGVSSREINGLEPGNHVIWAEARVGTLSVRKQLAAVYILPPWYRSWWAYVLYTWLALIGLGMAAMWVVRRYRRGQEALRADKLQALQVKEAEIEQITQSSHETIQRIQEEKLHSEIAFKNQELTSATMHLLAKNKFLQHVKNELEDIRKKPSSDSQTEIRRLVRQINQNLNDEDDWDRFAFHFSQVHRGFFAQLKDRYPELTPQDLKLCAYLRLNMSTKEIAQMLNITVRGVETSRYRLRKRLELGKDTNLTEFIMGI